MDEATEQAITYKFGHEFETLRSSITRYIVEQETASHSRALALREGFSHLRTDLLPEMRDRMIKFCLDLHLTDADLITSKLRSLFEPQVKALGQSLGVSFQALPMSTREMASFISWVTPFFATGLSSRVHVAVVERLHATPAPVPVVGPGGTFISVTGSGQVINNSPGSSQAKQDAPPPSPPPTPPPPEPATPPKSWFWKWTERTNWVVGIPAGIVAVLLGAIALSAWLSHKSVPEPSAAPAPPMPVVPPVPSPVAPPPTVPAPQKAEPLPSPPEQPKVQQPVKHARKPAKTADDAGPKTAAAPAPAPAPPREDPKPTTTPSAPAVPAPAPVAAVAPAAPPPQPKPAPSPPPPRPPSPDPLVDNYGDRARANSPTECPKILKKCEEYFGGQEFECRFAYLQCKETTATGQQDYYWMTAGRMRSYGPIAKGAKPQY